MEVIKKPWGCERILERNDKYVMKILEVDSGSRLSLQYHNVKVETMYCLYGYGVLIIQEEGIYREVSLLPGRYFTVKAGVIHRLDASHGSPLAVLECSTPELNDLVRLEDDYDKTRYMYEK